MPNDDSKPNLSELDDDYQILTELHRTANSSTYLARHLQLNRDVTITVVRAAGNRDLLKRFAADVERLKTARHSHVIPVIEGRWLGNDAFAVIRARVRGSTLEQMVSTVGPIPLAQIAGTLGDVRSALDWARTAGIEHRTVSPDAMIFQQGSGRVLLALDPAPSVPLDVCDDTRTLGRIGWEMLAGRPYATVPATPLAALRPDLPPALVAETEAMVRCTRSAPRDVGAYLAMLAGTTGARAATAVALPPAAPASKMLILDPSPRYSDPVGTVGAAVVARKQKWGFNARLATAVAVIAVIVVMAFMFMHGRTRTLVDRTAVNDQSQPAPGEAAGDVALHAQHPDTSMLTATPPIVAQVVTPDVEPTPSPTPMPTPIASASQNANPRSPIAPPDTRRHEPLRTAPPYTFPVPGMPDHALSPDTPRPDNDAAVVNNDVCASPTPADQHRCLINAIDRNDADLNAVYRSLITALRRQANVPSDDLDPDSVKRLRKEQRQWLDERDQACHAAGAGPLYARDRAQCFANQSAKRTHDLQQQLDGVPQGA